jgi:hypothetical protein
LYLTDYYYQLLLCHSLVRPIILFGIMVDSLQNTTRLFKQPARHFFKN